MIGLTQRYGWSVKHVILLVVLAAAAIFAGLEQWRVILMIAMKDEEASHIFLVIPIAAWLVWVRRVRFRCCPPRASWVGPLIILAGFALLYFSYRNAFQAGLHGGAVLMLVGAIVSVVG